MATYYAATSGEISKREKEHMQLVRELAGECMTLLENDGTLPLKSRKNCFVWKWCTSYCKRRNRIRRCKHRSVATIEEGMEAAGFEITTKSWLEKYASELYSCTERILG